MDAVDTRHLLRRLAFAATPAQESSLRPLTGEAAVTALFEQARKTTAPAPPVEMRQPWMNTALRTAGSTSAQADGQRAAQIRSAQQDIEQIRQWWLREMITGSSPLTDTLALFFHGVFGMVTATVDIPHALYGYTATLRAAATMTIPELLEALITDPAMMIQIGMDEHGRDRVSDRPAKLILDNWTVGAGEYKEHDVEDLSRAITGWVLQSPGAQPAVDRGAPRALRRTGIVPMFNRAEFDAGKKTILGTTQDFDAKSAIAFLAHHPATARRYARLLVQHFGVQDPDNEVAALVARAYETTDGSIEAMLRAMVSAKPFWSAESRWALIKSPVHLAVGACRQLEIANPPLAEITRWLTAAGQTLFETPSNGEAMWPGGTVWVTPPDRLLVRYQLPVVLSGRMPAFGLAARPHTSTATPAEIPLSASLRGASSSALVARLDAAPGIDAPRGASPSEIIRRVMTTPQYQLA